MEYDSIHNKLKDLLDKTGGKLKILEEQIDVEMQVEFFEWANKLLKQDIDEVKVENAEILLFNEDYPEELKKELLVNLSNSKEVQHYRFIEKYIDKAKDNLKKWAILAFQHARISLESDLLDEQQVFISTGLGGKGEKLRYFLSAKLKTEDKFSASQKKIVKNEFEYWFNKDESVIEKIDFAERYVTILALIPVSKPISGVVEKAIEEVNHFGSFLFKEYLITNVKVLSMEEIVMYFKKKGV